MKIDYVSLLNSFILKYTLTDEIRFIIDSLYANGKLTKEERNELLN